VDRLARFAGAAAMRFALAGRVVRIEPLRGGHIHASFAVVAHAASGERRYVLQRMNRAVFPQPEAILRNVERVSAHLADKVRDEGGDPQREGLTLLRTPDGAAGVLDEAGDLWRCCAMIERARSRATVADPRVARTVAAAFGRFLRRMEDFPLDNLEPAVRHFHDTGAHVAALWRAVRADEGRRARRAHEELHFVEARGPELEEENDGRSTPCRMRPIHGDTKVDNVLIDDETGRGICVIDLDTVMPGRAAIDIADCARSAMTGREERGRRIDLCLFEAVVGGFLAELGEGCVGAEEVVTTTQRIAFELGVRFLTDFLSGDRRFPVRAPCENLARCRVQFRLVREMERRQEEMVRRAGAAAAAASDWTSCEKRRSLRDGRWMNP